MASWQSVGRVRRSSPRAVLDSTGAAAVTFDVPSANHRWILESVVANASGASVAVFPQVVIYLDSAAQARSEGGSWTGGQETFQGRIDMDCGNTLTVQFTQGTPGQVVNAIIEGESYLWR